MGGPYQDGEMAPLPPPIFRKTSTVTMNWIGLNSMEEAEGGGGWMWGREKETDNSQGHNEEKGNRARYRHRLELKPRSPEGLFVEKNRIISIKPGQKLCRTNGHC